MGSSIKIKSGRKNSVRFGATRKTSSCLTNRNAGRRQKKRRRLTKTSAESSVERKRNKRKNNTCEEKTSCPDAKNEYMVTADHTNNKAKKISHLDL